MKYQRNEISLALSASPRDAVRGLLTFIVQGAIRIEVHLSIYRAGNDAGLNRIKQMIRAENALLLERRTSRDCTVNSQRSMKRATESSRHGCNYFYEQNYQIT